MNEQATCPECVQPLPEGSSHDLCPACLMGQVMASRTFDTAAGNETTTPPPTPEEIADKFPQFEVVECLGRGGMGVVYKARQKSLDRWVAIKVLAPERVHEERFAEHFEREAKTLAKMSHPNIVTVFDHGQTDGLFYIVMEFVDGLNLRDLLREAKIEPEQALAIIPPICDALEYAHDKGVVHRDIKPENILLDRNGRVKIADFGIASLVGVSGEKSGTPPYMAPEQANGIVDRRADIYALGVVLYEMLTGERPNKELVAPSRKVQIDVRLDEIVLRALEKTPELRYQTAGEFRTQVETMVGSLPAAERAAQYPRYEADEVPSRSTRLPYIGLIALLAGVWWTYLWRHDPEEGRSMRPTGVIVAAVGLFVMLRGLLQAVGSRRVPSAPPDASVSLHRAGNASVAAPRPVNRVALAVGFGILVLCIFGTQMVLNHLKQADRAAGHAIGAHRQTIDSDAKPAFGPVIEREIPSGKACLRLATGELIPLSEPALSGEDVREVRGDVFQPITENDTNALMILDVNLLDLDAAAWEKLSASDLENQFARKTETGRASQRRSDTRIPPGVYGFKTHDKSGILQVLGMNGGGVKVRYKLVESEVTTAATAFNQITGRLVDYQMNPVAGATILVPSISEGGKIYISSGKIEEPSETDITKGLRTITDADGRFSLTLAPESARFLLVTTPTFLAWIVPDIEPGQETLIALPQPASFVIRYDVPGGPEMARFDICLNPSETPGWKDKLYNASTSISIRNGQQATIGNLPPGVYDIQRRKDAGNVGVPLDWPNRFVLEAGESKTADFTRKGERVHGTVTDLREFGLTSALIQVTEKRPETNSPTTALRQFDIIATGPDGTFETEALPPGNYTFRASAALHGRGNIGGGIYRSWFFGLS